MANKIISMSLQFRAGSVKIKDDAGFKEEDHPRAPDGKFTSGAAGGENIQNGMAFPKANTAKNFVWQTAHQYEQKFGKKPNHKQIKEYLDSKGIVFPAATVSHALSNYNVWAKGKSDKQIEEKIKEPEKKEPEKKEPEKKEPEKKEPEKKEPEPGHPLSTKSAPKYASASPSKEFNYNSHGVPDAYEGGFPQGIVDSIRAYTGDHEEINRVMRFESDLDNVSPDTMKKILQLQKAFHIVPPTEKESTVIRVIGTDALKAMAHSAGIENLQEITEGSIFSDDAIISTSHTDIEWEGDVRMNIKIPKGAKAIYVANVSQHSDEDETLLPPGTRFKINKIKHYGGSYGGAYGGSYGGAVIDCEVMI